MSAAAASRLGPCHEPGRVERVPTDPSAGARQHLLERRLGAVLARSRGEMRPGPARTPAGPGRRRRWPASARRRPRARRRRRWRGAARLSSAGRPRASATHSAFQARPSRSWSWTCPPAARRRAPGASRASVSRCSLDSGLRLCGIMMLLDDAGGAASRSSPISGRWSSITSLPMRARVPVTPAMHRGELGDAVPAGEPGDAGIGEPEALGERRRAAPARRSPKKPSVPTAPPSWPTSQRRRPSCRRSRWRPTSSAHVASLAAEGDRRSGLRVRAAGHHRPLVASAQVDDAAMSAREVAVRRGQPTSRHRQREPGVGQVLHGGAVVDVLGDIVGQQRLEGHG